MQPLRIVNVKILTTIEPVWNNVLIPFAFIPSTLIQHNSKLTRIRTSASIIFRSCFISSWASSTAFSVVWFFFSWPWSVCSSSVVVVENVSVCRFTSTAYGCCSPGCWSALRWSPSFFNGYGRNKRWSTLINLYPSTLWSTREIHRWDTSNSSVSVSGWRAERHWQHSSAYYCRIVSAVRLVHHEPMIKNMKSCKCTIINQIKDSTRFIFFFFFFFFLLQLVDDLM